MQHGDRMRRNLVLSGYVVGLDMTRLSVKVMILWEKKHIRVVREYIDVAEGTGEAW